MSPPIHSIRIDEQEAFFASSEDLSFLGGTRARLVVTSPPYWDLKDYGHPGQIGPGSYEEYLERLDRVWEQCFRHSTDDAVLVVNVGSRRSRGEFFPIAFDVARRAGGWRLWDTLVWYVPNALPQTRHYSERLFDNKFEHLLVFTKGGDTGYTFHKPRVPQKYAVADPREHKRNPRGRCLGNVLRIPAYKPPNVKKLGYHAAAYPEELAALVVESFTDAGDVVLDPFLGSGTTLKVCRGTGRRGVGVEINRAFAPLIERRIREPWEEIDWKKLDILHSATMRPGVTGPRKAHLLK